MAEILVLFYSRKGSTAELARSVCRGVESVSGARASIPASILVGGGSSEEPDPPQATGGDADLAVIRSELAELRATLERIESRMSS